MKKFIVVILCLIASFTYAGTSITVGWDANPEPHCPIEAEVCLVGYSLYSTFNPGMYKEPYPYPSIDIPAGVEEVTIIVDDEDVYFVLTAKGMCRDEATGVYYPCESGYSNEIHPMSVEEEQGNNGGCFITLVNR